MTTTKTTLPAVSPARPETPALEALAALGFSEIEARVYAFLLAGPPATGYRISHEIGKPTANTYKAIAALQAKGALMVDDGDNKLCRAVPPEEFLAGLDHQFQRSRERAEDELAKLHRPQADDRIYQLASSDQVIERARAMLDGAQSIALLDVFPEPLRKLRADLERASRRGVRLALKTYEDGSAPSVGEKAIAVNAPDPSHALEQWPGQQLSLVVDAEQHLLALLSEDLREVRQAIWSPSLFLSSMHHNQLASEILFTLYESLSNRLDLEADAQTRLDEARQITVLRASPPGMTRLRALYQSEAKSPVDPLRRKPNRKNSSRRNPSQKESRV